MSELVDYYKLLGIKYNASDIEIRIAYRQKAKLYHPDLNNSEEASEMMRILNEANDVFRNPVKKIQYDSKLKEFYSVRAVNKYNMDNVVTSENGGSDLNPPEDKMIKISIVLSSILIGSIVLYYLYISIVNGETIGKILLYLFCFSIPIGLALGFMALHIYVFLYCIYGIFKDLKFLVVSKDTVKFSEFVLLKYFALAGQIYGFIVGYTDTKFIVLGLWYSLLGILGCSMLCAVVSSTILHFAKKKSY